MTSTSIKSGENTTSPRVALVMSGITSPAFSMIAFALRLKNVGHIVQVFAPAPLHRFLEHAQLAHCVIPVPKLSVWTPLIPNRERRKLSGPKRREKAIEALGVADFRDQLERFDPSVIVVDCEMHAHIIAALSTGRAVIQASNLFLSPPSLRNPPLHINVIAGRGVRGTSLGIGVIWGLFFLKKAAKALRRWLRDRRVDQPSTLFALARQHGLHLWPVLRLRAWQHPWTYRIPTMLFLPKALDLDQRQDPFVTHVGSMIWRDKPAGGETGPSLDSFLAPEDVRPKIYVAFGSSMTPADGIVGRIWQVAAQRPDWAFLFVVGPHWVERPDAHPPSNVHVVDWAPQYDVLGHCDLAIFHGGTSSLVEAVDQAVPMLVYPHVLDQPGSAARVVHNGLGRAGSPGDPPDVIEQDIEAILTDPEVKRRSILMQRACRAEEEAARAETMLLSNSSKG